MTSETVDALIGRDVDAEIAVSARRARPVRPIRRTRASWTSGPASRHGCSNLAPASRAPAAGAPSGTKYRVLMRKSQRPASLGNVVRAAIYHARAERCAPPQFAGRVRSAADKMDVDRLIGRLQAALEIERSSPQPWQESLFALVSQTPRGIWTVEARLLYDLQKVCVDHERDIYTVDLVEWALSWGRRPDQAAPAQPARRV